MLPLYEENELREDKAYIAKKLGISVEQLEQVIHDKNHDYSEYANWDFCYKLITIVKKLVQKVISRNLKSYS